MLAKHLQNLQVIAEDGVTYALYTGGNPTNFLFLDGAGVATVRRITQRTPLQNGVTDRGYRLEPRKMTLALFINENSELYADVQRDLLAYIFGPTNAPIYLRATRLDNTIRQIACYVDGTLEFPQSERMGASQKVLVPLFCPDPTWYDPTQIVSTNTFSASPLTVNITNSDFTADDWPIIDVTGPITGLTITHSVTTEALTLSTAVLAGETYRIDLRPGYKTIKRTSDNAERIGYLTDSTSPNMATIRILAYKDMKRIDSSFTAERFVFTGTGLTGASSVSISYYKRYISL